MSTDISTETDKSEPPKVLKRGDRQTRFLAQSVILEEAGSSGLIRIGMITISVVICAFIVWAAVTDVDEIATTSGEVLPTGQIQSIQHLEGGIIKEINIAEGEVVEKNQVLIKIDPAEAQTELELMKIRRAGLELQAERLRAIGAGREPDFSIATEEYEDLVEDQISIYNSQFEASENRRLILLNQIEQRKTEIKSINEQESTLSRNADLMLEEFLMREDLYKKGLATKLSYLDIKRQLNQSRGDLANLVTERSRTSEALIEAQNKLSELDTNAKEQALAEMGVATSELAQINESMNKLSDRVRRLEIISPVRGIIKGLKVHTVTGVIPPGAVIMEVVPLDKELIVETRISTKDVGHVSIGQPVTVKVATFDFSRFGGISGELKDISATTFLDEQGEPYYKGIVGLDRSYVGFNPEENRVMPGMTVQADIKTGKKTLLSYLLKPVVSSISSSFRER